MAVTEPENRATVWKAFDQNVISHSAAHHLMAIDDLVSRLGYARVSDIAKQLDITRGSVSISMKSLREAGFVVQDENRHLQLSETGQRLVDQIKVKRLLMRRLLAEVLGVNPVQAQIDACKLEHLLSNESAARLFAFLKFIDASEPEAARFIAALRAYEASCAGETAACPSCESVCIAETVVE